MKESEDKQIITTIDPELIELAKRVADEHTPPTDEDITNLANDLAKFSD